MTPLRLEWTLATPVAGLSYPLHLDALVAFAVTARALRDSERDDVTSVRDLADALPLRRVERDGEWCWAASALVPLETSGHSQRIWTRRTDVYDLATRIVGQQIKGRVTLPLEPFALKIDTARGPLKNHFQHIPVRHIRRFAAWCIGDAGELEELLHPEAGFIRSLGKRGRSGLGQITEFCIAEDPAAGTLWENRFLPWPKEGFVPLQASHRPPYWAIGNVVSNTFAPPGIFA